jgi:hypothetical protein
MSEKVEVLTEEKLPKRPKWTEGMNWSAYAMLQGAFMDGLVDQLQKRIKRLEEKPEYLLDDCQDCSLSIYREFLECLKK